MSETPSRIASGEGLAPGHNPDRLTPEQVGVPEWRLLDEDEKTKASERDSWGYLREIEGWRNGCWDNSGWTGDVPGSTYRTRLSRAALRAARGLAPEKGVAAPETPRKECVCGYPRLGMQDPTRCQNCGGVYDWEVMKRRQREQAAREEPREDCTCTTPRTGMVDPFTCVVCGGLWDSFAAKRRARERARTEMVQQVREIEEGTRCIKCGYKTHPWCLCNEPKRRPDPLEMANVAPKSEVPEEVAEAANHPSAFWLGFAAGAGLVTITGAVAAILLFR